ncbi:zinc transporter permease [Saccharopolyspora elongata]|uniref:Zinc transporter permease n=1 Tax=Saccharopolyspora elongata TaxID=2530387 RepID=A0A4R4XXB1_9PSEU|nr:zinc transporter permease [Saccharopolyspora elongata]
MVTMAHQEHPAHEHGHGEGCGHVVVPHGDHVDYIHDGHRHAVRNSQDLWVKIV